MYRYRYIYPYIYIYTAYLYLHCIYRYTVYIHTIYRILWYAVNVYLSIDRSISRSIYLYYTLYVVGHRIKDLWVLFVKSQQAHSSHWAFYAFLSWGGQKQSMNLNWQLNREVACFCVWATLPLWKHLFRDKDFLSGWGVNGLILFWQCYTLVKKLNNSRYLYRQKHIYICCTTHFAHGYSCLKKLTLSFRYYGIVEDKFQ